MERRGERDAFDLAAELAGEIDGLGDDSRRPPPAEDDFQYSVEEVFAEFKKGLEKVVKPEDVDTHYDLGIAYKEMGLHGRRAGRVRRGAQGLRGHQARAGLHHHDRHAARHARRARRGRRSSSRRAWPASTPPVRSAKALGFELALRLRGPGATGKALYHYQRVAKLDPKYRDVSAHVSRLAASTTPEDDPLPPSGAGAGFPPTPAAAAGTPKARKVGYV